MATGRTTRSAAASAPFRAGAHLRSDAETAAYLKAKLADCGTAWAAGE